MPKTKKQVKITVDIQQGRGSPAQKAAWRKFFTRLIAECQRELKAKAENKAKREQ